MVMFPNLVRIEYWAVNGPSDGASSSFNTADIAGSDTVGAAGANVGREPVKQAVRSVAATADMKRERGKRIEASIVCSQH